MNKLRNFWIGTILLLICTNALSILAINRITEAFDLRYLLLGMALGTFLMFGLAITVQIRCLSEELRRKTAFQAALLNSTHAAIISTTPDGIITSLSRGLERLLGYRVEELVDKQSLLLFHDVDEIAVRGELSSNIKPCFETLITLLGRKEEYEWIYLHKDGAHIPMQLSISAMHDDEGNLIGFICLATDITHRKEAETRLKNAEKLTSSVLDTLSKHFCVLDQGGHILAINKPRIDFENDRNLQTLEIGQNYPELLDSGQAKNRGGKIFSEGIRAVLNGTESSFLLEYSHRSPSSQHWFTGKVLPFPDQELGRVIVIYENISEYKRLEHRFRLAAESAPYAIVMVAESGAIVMINAQTEALFGYSRTELLGQSIEILVPEHLRHGHVDFRQAYFSASESKPMCSGFNLYGQRKDGSVFPAELGLSIIDSHEEKLVLSTIIDITERQAIQEALKTSEAALKEAQRLAGLGCWKLDVHSGALSWSEEIYRLYGLDPTQPPVTYPEIKQFYTPASWTRLSVAMKKGLTEGESYELDAEVVRPDDTRRWIVARGEATRDATGTIINMHGTVQDITERKFANDKLQAALNEKKLLLKEVYHRVKNNLQVVSSLINLQASNVKNKEAADQLRQSANRIKSMALIHEKLYQSNSLAKIDFNAYIHSLAEHLLLSQTVHPDRIKLNMVIDDLFLDFDTAIPCGMIINELLSNAIKHAFPNDRHGNIGISFRQEQGEFNLVISDNGIGFPPQLDYKKCDSLGLQLVNTLSNQLQGLLTLDQTNGSTFTIRFT